MHMMSGMASTPQRAAVQRWRLVIWSVAAAPLVYLLATLAEALIHANPGWQPPQQGVPIFMRTNGVHTSIVVTAASEGIDCSPLLRAGHFGSPDLAADSIALGCGREIFYYDPAMGR